MTLRELPTSVLREDPPPGFDLRRAVVGVSVTHLRNTTMTIIFPKDLFLWEEDGGFLGSRTSLTVILTTIAVVPGVLHL